MMAVPEPVRRGAGVVNWKSKPFKPVAGVRTTHCPAMRGRGGPMLFCVQFMLSLAHLTVTHTNVKETNPCVK